MKPLILFLLILSFLDANALKYESSPYLQQHKKILFIGTLGVKRL